MEEIVTIKVRLSPPTPKEMKKDVFDKMVAYFDKRFIKVKIGFDAKDLSKSMTTELTTTLNNAIRKTNFQKVLDEKLSKVKLKPIFALSRDSIALLRKQFRALRFDVSVRAVNGGAGLGPTRAERGAASRRGGSARSGAASNRNARAFNGFAVAGGLLAVETLARRAAGAFYEGVFARRPPEAEVAATRGLLRTRGVTDPLVTQAVVSKFMREAPAVGLSLEEALGGYRSMIPAFNGVSAIQLADISKNVALAQRQIRPEAPAGSVFAEVRQVLTDGLIEKGEEDAFTRDLINNFGRYKGRRIDRKGFNAISGPDKQAIQQAILLDALEQAAESAKEIEGSFEMIVSRLQGEVVANITQPFGAAGVGYFKSVAQDLNKAISAKGVSNFASQAGTASFGTGAGRAFLGATAGGLGGAAIAGTGAFMFGSIAAPVAAALGVAGAAIGAGGMMLFDAFRQISESPEIAMLGSALAGLSEEFTAAMSELSGADMRSATKVLVNNITGMVWVTTGVVRAFRTVGGALKWFGSTVLSVISTLNHVASFGGAIPYAANAVTGGAYGRFADRVKSAYALSPNLDVPANMAAFGASGDAIAQAYRDNRISFQGNRTFLDGVEINSQAVQKALGPRILGTLTRDDILKAQASGAATQRPDGRIVFSGFPGVSFDLASVTSIAKGGGSLSNILNPITGELNFKQQGADGGIDKVLGDKPPTLGGRGNTFTGDITIVVNVEEAVEPERLATNFEAALQVLNSRSANFSSPSGFSEDG